MTIKRMMLFQGGALFIAAALGQCNGNNSAVDGGVVDLATPAPDLSTVVPQLALTSVTPRSAVNTGGVQVTLTGTNFLGARFYND